MRANRDPRAGDSATTPEYKVGSALQRPAAELPGEQRAEEPRAAALAPAQTGGKTAIFVAHGMGQQMPYETLDQLAEGLRRRDPRWRKDVPEALPAPVSRLLPGNGEPARRLELQLLGPKGEKREVHLFEGYWAPLTEGNVRARDVVRFLFRAGKNGFKVGSNELRRWLFGHEESFPAQPRMLVVLLTVLAVVASLIALNTVLFVVIGLRTPFAQAPDWLTDGLVADLGTMFRAVLAVLGTFGFLLVLAIAARGLARLINWRAGSGWLVTLFNFAAGAGLFATCAVLISAVASLPFLFYGHFKLRGRVGAKSLWEQYLEVPTGNFDLWIDGKLAFLVKVAIGLGLLWWVVAVLRAIWRELLGFLAKEIRGTHFALTLLVAAGGAALFGGALYEVYVWRSLMLALPQSGLSAMVQASLAWILVFSASLWIRGLLIQYVGDVAAYVDSHTLDRFQELRNRIRDRVACALRIVYALRDAEGRFEYERVLVVGHSLGSVAVYDALNRLVNEDLLAATAGERRRAAERTPLLLTFGSPLDKLAFLFAAEGASAARNALSTAAQPLLQNYAYRPDRWVNLYSPWDVISGDLNYFDPQGPRSAKGILNLRDPHATTLLAAHVEYWGNDLLYRTIYDEAVKQGDNLGRQSG